ncbi:hypothetical protein [Polluticoccus soli]|uniref:hypothetical protein n=1 Tax=Polluticoccus soli TaxID=3034150 RepID=UPI0023E2C099|nr:hypothetical protein [Flavipsychrobacter sp. JY13-12]
MVKYYLLLLFCVLLSCKGKPERNLKVENESTVPINSSASEEQPYSYWKEILANVGESDLRNNRTEAYRFVYNIIYGNYLVLTVIALDNVDSNQFGYRISSKANLFCKLVIGEDSVAQSSKQELTEKEYSEFKEILNGTYYWALNNHPCWDGAIRDGNTAAFESKSYICYRDTLTYKTASLSPLYDGSFKDAFRYLLKRAAPFKGNLAAQKSIFEP